MSAQRHVDVLVVGLGPAGASAARTAALAGLTVLGVDRKRHPGEPVQCAEWIPAPLARYAQAQGVLQQPIRGMVSHLPSGSMERSDVPGLMVDRAAFDKGLAHQAGDAGAEIAFATQVLRLDRESSVAVLSVGKRETEVAYRMLVAADGPHSSVARALGLPPLEVVHTRQYTVRLSRPGADTEVWLSDEYPGGYAWLFPKGAWANLGLGAERLALDDLKQALDALHRELIAQGRVGNDIAYRTGGAIPVGGLREQLVVGNSLFVGDAGGFTHPVTGAGIAAAIASGERAGQAAGDFLHGSAERALDEFERDMREQFAASLMRAVMRRRQLAERRAQMGAVDEAGHRRAWVAFPDYFSELAEETAS